METSSYGSELVATIIITELTMEICYKIIITGVPIGGPAQIMGYNESVVNSFSMIYITLKNQHSDISYNWVREAVATGVIILEHIPGKSNPADLLTKPLGTHNNYLLMEELLV